VLDPADLVFVDESGTNLAMTPRYGRAPRGQRVVGTAPRNHGPNTTLIAAMSPTGIIAVMSLEGAMDRDAFDVFVVQGLVPELRPGQTVIWDHLSVHQSAVAIARIEAAGCGVVFLPPYSPDVAPIEQAFGKQDLPATGRGTHSGGLRRRPDGRVGDHLCGRCPGLVHPLRVPTARTTAVRTALASPDEKPVSRE
jgi:hypothetical protein